MQHFSRESSEDGDVSVNKVIAGRAVFVGDSSPVIQRAPHNVPEQLSSC